MARIVRDHVQSKGKTTTTFDYTIAGEITMNEKEVYDSSSNIYEDTYIIKLNEQGNVASIQDDDKNTGTFSDYIRFSYTDDNRLAQWKDADAGSETSSIMECCQSMNTLRVNHWKIAGQSVWM